MLDNVYIIYASFGAFSTLFLTLVSCELLEDPVGDTCVPLQLGLGPGRRKVLGNVC